MDLFYLSSVGLFDVSQMLNNLKTEWDSYTCEVPEADSSCGGVATELELIGAQYVNLYNAMSDLLQNTINMFVEVGNTLDETDGEMSDSIVEG